MHVAAIIAAVVIPIVCGIAVSYLLSHFQLLPGRRHDAPQTGQDEDSDL